MGDFLGILAGAVEGLAFRSETFASGLCSLRFFSEFENKELKRFRVFSSFSVSAGPPYTFITGAGTFFSTAASCGMFTIGTIKLTTGVRIEGLP